MLLRAKGGLPSGTQLRFCRSLASLPSQVSSSPRIRQKSFFEMAQILFEFRELLGQRFLARHEPVTRPLAHGLHFLEPRAAFRAGNLFREVRRERLLEVRVPDNVVRARAAVGLLDLVERLLYHRRDSAGHARGPLIAWPVHFRSACRPSDPASGW